MTLKLGRKAAERTLYTMRAAIAMARALDPLGAAPANSNDYVSAVEKKTDWKMLLNDELGCCVCSDTGHGLMLRTANTGQIVIPSDADIEKLYEIVGGYNPADASTDQGCVENDMCKYLKMTGFLGHKSQGTGSIDPSETDHIKWCIQLFGACRIGIRLPQYAMTQFENGYPWDISTGGDQSIIGGHDVPLVQYDGGNYTAISWGKKQPMTQSFFDKFCEEAHVELFFDWVQKQGIAPSGFNLDQLAADMADL